MQNQFRIGFIGVGRMGANMARRLSEMGFQLTSIFDRHSSAAADLAEQLHITRAHTPAAVAQTSSVIITAVSDDQAMRAIFAEQDETSLLTHAHDRLFINCATLSPDVHCDIEQLVTVRGGASIEACMAGSITQARQGTLYLMCGGTRNAFDRARPVLDAMGTTVRYIGPAGKAAAVKALVNMVMNSNTAALAEGLGLGEALEIDVQPNRCCVPGTGDRRRRHAAPGARVLFFGCARRKRLRDRA